MSQPPAVTHGILHQRYLALPPFHKKVLQFLAVAYAPFPKNVLKACIRDATPKFGSRRMPVSMPRILNDLQAQGLVLFTGASAKVVIDIANIAMWDAIDEGDLDGMAKVIEHRDTAKTTWYYGQYRSFLHGVRQVRLAVQKGEEKTLDDALSALSRQFPREYKELPPLLLACCQPFVAKRVDSLASWLVQYVISKTTQRSVAELQPIDDIYQYLAKRTRKEKDDERYKVYFFLLKQQLLRGDIKGARQTLEGRQETSATLVYQGWIDFVTGDYSSALKNFEQALKLIRKGLRRRKAQFQDLDGFVYALALLEASEKGLPDAARRLAQYCDNTAEDDPLWVRTVSRAIHHLLRIRTGNIAGEKALVWPVAEVPDATRSADSPFIVDGRADLFTALAIYWGSGKLQKRTIDFLERQRLEMQRCGYHWMEATLSDLLARVTGSSTLADRARSLQKRNGFRSVMDILPVLEPWEQSLKALERLAEMASKPAPATASSGQSKRMVWWLFMDVDGDIDITPREQSWKKTRAGGWTKGRVVALSRLATETDSFPYLTDQDLRVCAALHQETYRTYYRTSEDYYFDTGSALKALVGHPAVYWSETTQQVEIVEGRPELSVQEKGDNLVVSLDPLPSPNHPSYLVTKEDATRLRILEFTDDHLEMLRLLGSKGLRIPKKVKDRALEAITRIAPLANIQSDFLLDTGTIEKVPAQPIPHIVLRPYGKGLKLELLVRPFGAEGPYYRAGSGSQTVIAEVNGIRVQAKRELEIESEHADAVIRACPSLDQNFSFDKVWQLDDPEQCLETLLELQSLEDSVRLDWPEGEKLKVSREAGLNQLKVQIKRERDWFSASGSLQVDENLALDLQELMTLLEASPGKFVALGEGRFLALTAEFRRRLEDMRHFAQTTKKGLRFHPLVSSALETFTDEVGELEGDKHWKEHLKRLKEARHLETPVPSTLQATLRDYQIEGFQWLSRLSHWGVGACLADDMGLGKTLQALAVIIDSAPKGPSLVVAPTSVSTNWVDETRRFAPTLNPILLGSGNRSKIVDEAKPFDLVICSYGLLIQEAELLSKVEWEVVVLDEAQAIKNPATKRSKAAHMLQGKFKVITTGTPIENHLGELWNLSRFINPGLLGSLDRFNKHYIQPIERSKDKQARSRLRRLVQPYILRRTKSQVLEELPPRTEILLRLQASPEEAAFYEAIRRKAIETLEAPAEPGMDRPLRILAEITRLRRACCNPRLVLPESALSSAKLKAFDELLEELLENRHKALVFSQFVGHLTILREHLEKKNVSYQYLDGSTPTQERRRRVQAFQSGVGDVFLISLKAGGLGLNLTAADYVIHMDPWWNPAVEDQASDRAHRIGQQRPVTIYRMVIAGTIEEKIVELHHEKRDLADSLLEGTDSSGRLSAEELLKLMMEG